MFTPGTLWEKLTHTTAAALRSGALQPIPTTFELVEDAGVQFLVRVATRLAAKERLAAITGQASAGESNPFQPYDPAMHIADVSDSHVLLLNKYNVVPQHLLIITRRFQHQEEWLNVEDFVALWTCMSEYDGLGFYNAGAVAGASQIHKHLQLVPLPLAEGAPAVPIEPLLDAARFQNEIGQSDALPFPHAVARLDPGLAARPAEAARASRALYRALLSTVGLADESHALGPRGGAYNLLVTRRWMLLVPRCRESFQSISLNALAFAGALLVQDERQLAVLKESGPMAALKHVAG